jgi:hypothetical protein
MFFSLALQNILHRRWRTVMLLVGYGLGVAVMIVLLSVGEALVAQARDERLIGGGSITVLPEGIEVEVLKTGGLGGMFFSIDHARFIYRQLLAAPRLAPLVRVVSPQIDGKLLYLRTADGREVPVLASGDLPSRTAAVGALPPLATGAWTDDGGDRQWRDPTMVELRHEIDHFHRPEGSARGDPTWAEWHYFNVLWPNAKRWAFISLIVGGDVTGPDTEWGGQVLVTVHEEGKTARRFTALMPPRSVQFSTSRANVVVGESSVTVLSDGRYGLRARAIEDETGVPLRLTLTVDPRPRAYFPGAALADQALVSGYVVPALRADATGEICIADSCEQLSRAQAYHDHNWGIWRGVTWEWGTARAGELSLLYGRIHPADTSLPAQPLFVYLVDSLGFRALFRPRMIDYEDSRTVRVGGVDVRVPARATLVDVRGDDTLRITVDVEDAAVTDVRKPAVERGDAGARHVGKPYFVQMKGRATISGRVGGEVLSGSGYGFFETYR